MAWYQPRHNAKPIFRRPHQQPNVALFGPCAALGRRRADRHPCLGTRLGNFVIRRPEFIPFDDAGVSRNSPMTKADPDRMQHFWTRTPELAVPRAPL